jgi:hypothetical protein
VIKDSSISYFTSCLYPFSAYLPTSLS